MTRNGSKMYIVDENYKIVYFNEMFKISEPDIEVGEYCYKCLENREEPCRICPVKNKTYGRQIYYNHKSDRYISCECVEMDYPGVGRCHAIVGSDKHFSEDIERELELAHKRETIRMIGEALNAGEWSAKFTKEKGLTEIRVSNEARRLVGYDGTGDFDLDPEYHLSRVFPEDRDSLAKAFEKVLNDDNDNLVLRLDIRYMVKNGKYRWFRIQGKPVRIDGGKAKRFFGLFTDIDDRKREQIATREQHDVMNSLGNMYRLVYLIDLRYDYLKQIKPNYENEYTLGVNNIAQKILYRSCEDSVLKEYKDRMWKFLTLSTLAKRLSLRESVWRQCVAHYNLKGREIVEWIECQFVVAKRAEDGTVEQVLFLIKSIDVDKRKELDSRRELERTKDTLEIALEEARTANLAKTLFLSNVSHDIRTPMNAIIGYTTMAANHMDDKEKLEEYITKIAISGEHLMNLLDEVLFMSRIESGKMVLQERNDSLSDIIDNVVNIIQPIADKNNLDFYVDTRRIIHDEVTIDAAKFERILINLLTNAVKYTSPGGTIILKISETEEGKNSSTYEVVVKDTGKGISKEFMSRLFQPFERERDEDTMSTQGTGLGLAIVKKMVDIMYGAISAESEEGKGTTFTIRIPLQNKVSKPKKKHSKNVLGEIKKSSYAGCRILLAEDIDYNREIAENLLMESGFVVDSVANGLEAYDAVKRHDKGYYALVLMDIQMPVMNGYDATRKIRQLDGCNIYELPIIALSANAYEEDVQEALDHGMNGHLSKPVKLDRIIKEIEKSIGE